MSHEHQCNTAGKKILIEVLWGLCAVLLSGAGMMYSSNPEVSFALVS